jgi:hypothetical protein
MFNQTNKISTDQIEKENVEQIVSSLQKYIIGQKIDETDLNSNNNNSHNSNNSNNSNNQKNKVFPSYLLHIKDKDKLFWAFYIMIHGEDAYKYLKTKFVAEKEIKIGAVEKMHKISNIFKQHKLNKVRIETELSGDAPLTLEGFFGLCVIYNISAIFTKKNCYCELYGLGKDNSQHVVEEIEGEGIGIHVFKSNTEPIEKASSIRSTKWKMESVLAPIKSISSYTHSELLEIYKKVVSNTVNAAEKEKKTKQYMYDRICEQLV